ncbi:hypothetical protein Ctob_015295 [Chrysochromulina tobinii]|uniref:Uncharacterized protein n=1 Tax=Chrysochromulina tobinii TaxID=1460289 RepID=A0A0M0K7I9_9EUKA|nr:hypothetical protein Ctob_015295 [Chrysochromulina tobinii]|eukprot:KOO34785.1 hypothetical protein Ctob_015295 [Chrysochromulina sp. CCMP291]
MLSSSNLNKVRTALTFSASAIARAPSAPILLRPTSRNSVRTAMNFSASAIALAPSSPILLLPRSSSVTTAMNFRSDAIRMASAGCRLWSQKSAAVWSHVMPESMMPFSAPILASFLANSTSNLFWSKLQLLSTDVAGMR